MKKVFLIRHGNAYDESWREGPESALNESGMKHAEALAERFKDFRVDEVFCSTMERSKNTCKIFLKYHSDVKAEYRDDVREVLDEAFASDHEKLEHLKGIFDPICSQVCDSFKRILSESKGENVFIFTHGHWIRFLVLKILEGSIDGFFNMNVDFASVTMVEVKSPDKMVLHLFNDASHTKGLPYGCCAW
ncbi:hypothetical protein A2716_02985 [candidate division WWE3 bacterium RIFCSPHIGHO2_01_FULL_40_23]|uniref:Phosphoglycerate mutase n=1 Tax=candidate division WWE3 bacterium RIFCSPLOWO2_01_FULL_41_18 TaxID=1802625 RepID=A0A1F4VC31_UNCKA|nr:MAG: hypothetical protein A2716_02985 [candidate division WWE3 bacterium RIFCSPHIGHO2_01_FULL_40_23]OGC54796.1 MAG: hypothetical protein A3A78_04940 [candidate division WWE3 bacterium RIFCSPLOWO2_01_FULL_41_18]